MASEDNNQVYYDDFSAGYERERAKGYHVLIDELEVESVVRYARHGHILEAGCGTGLVLERLAKVARSAKGIDLSPGMLEKAKARGLDVSLGSVTALPFEDDTFDFVCSFKVLAHVPDLGGALREFARVTKPGGHFAFELYNPWSLRYLAKRIAGPQPISEGRTEADVYTRWDTPTSIERVLPPGTKLVEVRGVRVLTPAAFVHKIPGIAQGLAFAERVASHSPLRWFGGFIVGIAQKSPNP